MSDDLIRMAHVARAAGREFDRQMTDKEAAMHAQLTALQAENEKLREQLTKQSSEAPKLEIDRSPCAPCSKCADLAMMLRRVLRACVQPALIEKATDLLERMGFVPEILRAESTSTPEQSTDDSDLLAYRNRKFSTDSALENEDE